MRVNGQCELFFLNPKRWPRNLDHNLLFKKDKNENNNIVLGMERVVLRSTKKNL